MTCIVGIVEKDHIIIGGDSAATSGDSISIIKDPKVFKVGSFLFGCEGSFRFIQAIKHMFISPKLANKDINKFMCIDVVNEIMRVCEESKLSKTENNKFGSALIGFKNRIFELDDDFQIFESESGMSAIGGGADLALGSLYTSKGLNSYDRCLTALEAAETFNTSVSKPFTIIKT